MHDKNYNPSLGTPLYDQTVVLLGTVLAKSQEFAPQRRVRRTVTLIITDGGGLPLAERARPRTWPRW